MSEQVKLFRTVPSSSLSTGPLNRAACAGFFRMVDPVINQPCYSTENRTDHRAFGSLTSRTRSQHSRSSRNYQHHNPFEVMLWGDDVTCCVGMHVQVQTKLVLRRILRSGGFSLPVNKLPTVANVPRNGRTSFAMARSCSVSPAIITALVKTTRPTICKVFVQHSFTVFCSTPVDAWGQIWLWKFFPA